MDSSHVPPALMYEIRLRGIPPESLRERYPSMAVRTTPAQTILFRHVEGVSELDELLEEIRSVGLALSELHMEPPAAASRSAS
jgi:uncharacterized protein (UPF0128 family)